MLRVATAAILSEKSAGLRCGGEGCWRNALPTKGCSKSPLPPRYMKFPLYVYFRHPAAVFPKHLCSIKPCSSSHSCAVFIYLMTHLYPARGKSPLCLRRCVGLPICSQLAIFSENVNLNKNKCFRLRGEWGIPPVFNSPFSSPSPEVGF